MITIQLHLIESTSFNPSNAALLAKLESGFPNKCDAVETTDCRPKPTGNVDDLKDKREDFSSYSIFYGCSLDIGAHLEIFAKHDPDTLLHIE